MRIFADENVPTVVVVGLRAAGHDVSFGAEFGQGMSDIARLSDAYAEGRVVLTEDNDFAQLIVAGSLAAHGLVRFDLPGLGRTARAARILQGILEIGDAAAGRMHVIEPSRIRSRPLP